MKFSKILIMSFIFIMSGCSLIQSEEGNSHSPSEAETFSIDMFPTAKKGMTRQVIRLPKVDSTENTRVQLLVGREYKVDCNHYSFSANLKTKSLKGWGYTYYEMTNVKGPFSTMMACRDQTQRSEFVIINNIRDKILHYNDRLPLIIYVPEGFTVKYRIWHTDNFDKQAYTE